MGMSTGSRRGVQSEINVTPLVDVVLVLLIIFMVIMPLSLRGYDLDIPQASAAPPPPGPQPTQVVLGIDALGCPLVAPPAGPALPEGCRVRLDGESIPVASLSRRIGEIFAGRERQGRVLFLAVQEQLNYEGVLRIIDVARSGVEGLRIGLVSEQVTARGRGV